MEVEERAGVEPAIVRPFPRKTSYLSLPHKTQLLVLMLARFTESLAMSSVHAYMFFQLRYLSPDAPAAVITTQCGLVIGCGTGAHVCTGLLWGRLADRVLAGRKIVLVFGLLASSATIVGYGFSRTFQEAVVWQILYGALNATIAMVRCMTAELNAEKRHRVRAFTLLPLFANLGSMLGPLLGGFLVPAIPKHTTVVGHPYALPNICIAIIQVSVAIGAILFLTDNSQRILLEHKKGANLNVTVGETSSTRPPERSCSEDVDETTSLLHSASTPGNPRETQDTRNERASMPFTAIWTSHVVITMFAQSIIAGHLGAFATLWTMLLSLPVAPSDTQHLPFHFSGGLGLQPRKVGIAMSAFAFAGIILQIAVYPAIQARWGTVRVWRAALSLFPLVYFAAPFCALIPLYKQTIEGDNAIHYPVLSWTALLSILILFAAGRTGVVPATSLLINDCTPHPSVRGTIHTAGVICSNLSRSVFPPMALAVMGFGLQNNAVGLGFWFLAVLAAVSILVSFRVRNDMDGAER